METTEAPAKKIRTEKEREQAKRYYQKMKADPAKWAAYKKRSGVNTRRYYERLKHDFPKYEALLRKQNERHRLRRQSRSRTYLQLLERKRARRALDPFKARAMKKQSYERMRRDPVRYRRYLDRCLAWYYEMKKDPERHSAFLEGRKVYQRYRRIVKKAALDGEFI